MKKVSVATKKSDLTPKTMLALGVFGGRYMRDCIEVSCLSQFMETSDQLYGVTMEDTGQSKIVTVHIKEALNNKIILYDK